MKFFFHNLEIFISREKCRNISGSEMYVLFTIKFHSYDHDNVLFIERIKNFHFFCHKFIRDRSTNLTPKRLFIILLIIKKLLPVTIHFHNFLVCFFYNLLCYSDLSLFYFHTYAFKFSLISFFVFSSHSSFTSFSMEIRFLIRETYFRRKEFYKKSGNFFFRLKYFHDCKLKNFIHFLQLSTRIKC